MFGCATFTLAASAEPWLSASGSPRCPVRSELLAARVASAVVGELDPELRAAVLLHDSRQGTAATVSLSRGSLELGHRQLAAASCEQALAAVVAVTALALSSMVSTEPSAVAQQAPPVARPEPQPAVAAAAALREPVTPLDPGASGAAGAAEGALSLSMGADLTASTLVAALGGGVALRAGGGEWRAQLWYGLPALSEEEEALPLRSVQTRSDRGALALAHCRELGALSWLAPCAGLELGVVRHWRAQTLDGQARDERRWLEPWLAAALGAKLTYRASGWQPQLELSMLLPALDTADGRRIGLRARAGVAVPF